jgi:hypothetical protein
MVSAYRYGSNHFSRCGWSNDAKSATSFGSTPCIWGRGQGAGILVEKVLTISAGQNASGFFDSATRKNASRAAQNDKLGQRLINTNTISQRLWSDTRGWYEGRAPPLWRSIENYALSTPPKSSCADPIPRVKCHTAVLFVACKVTSQCFLKGPKLRRFRQWSMGAR